LHYSYENGIFCCTEKYRDLMIDLRSDTVTQPTTEMRGAMAKAKVGDDVFGEDPTINYLQEKIRDLTGKDAALFVASGTMGNQVCIKTHTQPGNEIIAEHNSHIYNYESGAPALLSNVQIMPIKGHRGSFTGEQVQEVIRPANVHHPVTALICIENTHNREGGTIFPFEEIKRISAFARDNNIRLHLDGARLWNASIATGISIADYCQYFDSVSLCFSKGLGSPVGSVIAGTTPFIQKAHYYRKVFGGGMRQAGILAAAALFALDNNIERLQEDHRRAKRLGRYIAKLPGIELDEKSLQTNIVIFDVRNSQYNGGQVIEKLEKYGIKMLTFAGTKIRAVTHLHITDANIHNTQNALKKIFTESY
jgi:threonine aldolase